jgi:CDP-diacylglycerol--glycerol-3-phosphate 3-phosphatidyltransferase
MRGDLGVLLGALILALSTMVPFGIRRSRRGHDALDLPDRGSFVLGGFVRSWFYWFIGPAEWLALKVGLSPLFFNLAGAGFGAAAGFAFASNQLVLGGWGVLFGGVADVMDGRIARARGLASPRGAFLDSTLDRFAEVAAFAGLAVYFQGRPLPALLVALALGGSLLVSYTRARGESQGVVCKVGVMQRAERLLLLGFGGLLDPAVADWTGWAAGTVLVLVVGAVALGTLATAIYRTAWISKRLPAADQR